MADETNAGMKAPATVLVPESVGCIGGVLARAFLALQFSLAVLDR